MKEKEQFIYRCKNQKTLVIRLLGEAALIDIPIGTKFWGETDTGKKYEGTVIDFERYGKEKIYIRVNPD